MLSRKKLEEMGLEAEQINSIMKDYGQGVDKAVEAEKANTAALEAQLSENAAALKKLQEDTASVDIEGMKAQIAELTTGIEAAQAEAAAAKHESEYATALAAHLEGIQFTSKGARLAYEQQLRTAHPEIKDGGIVGADKFLDTQRENDPGAFGTAKAGGEARKGGAPVNEADAFINAAMAAAGIPQPKE